MRTLGIRVCGDKIYLCIIDKFDKELILDKIILPPFFDFPRQLKYLRFNLIDILAEYNISHVSIKVVEYTAKKVNAKRCFIEGVIQESLATSNILDFTIENLKGLSKKLSISSNEYKNLINNQNIFVKYINDLGFEIDSTDKEKRESVLLALSKTMEK